MFGGEKYYRIAAITVITALIVGAVMIALPYPFFSSAPARETMFVIEEGESLGSVAHSLADQNLIMSRYLFVAYTIFAGQERKFQAGQYIIPPHASIRELVIIFAGGRAESEDITITVPEGTNLADLGKLLSKSGLAVGAGDFLGPEMLKKEGYLFPDTYRFKLGAKAEEVVQAMQNNFDEKVRRAHPTILESRLQKAVIIASILEKEVRNQRDMKLVAGIIEKRLSKNMPLEIDATVTYGVCYPEFLAGRYCDVSLANIIDNLKISTPYNTYVNKELPPGPISNPGLAAIGAALKPEYSEYLYYLTAKDGTTIFSKTAAEHEKARAKYLK